VNWWQAIVTGVAGQLTKWLGQKLAEKKDEPEPPPKPVKKYGKRVT
jgi:hypothetical protein